MDNRNKLWTAERIELMKHLWLREGLTAKQIAETLGEKITRNAVIGKIHRLGLNTQPRRISKIIKVKADSKTKNQSAPRPEKKAFPRPEKKAFPRSEEVRSFYGPNTVFVSSRSARKNVHACVAKAVDALRNDQCRWPVGDLSTKSFSFCPNSQVEGESYCLEHKSRAWEPISGRKSQKAVPFQLKNFSLAIYRNRPNGSGGS